MISLTDQLSNIVYVNPQHIVAMQVCGVNEICNLTRVNSETRVETYRTGFVRELYTDLSEHQLGVRLHFVTGEPLIVKECLADIKRLLTSGITRHD